MTILQLHGEIIHSLRESNGQSATELARALNGFVVVDITIGGVNHKFPVWDASTDISSEGLFFKLIVDVPEELR